MSQKTSINNASESVHPDLLKDSIKCSNMIGMVEYFLDKGLNLEQIFANTNLDYEYIKNENNWTNFLDMNRLVKNCQDFYLDTTIYDWGQAAYEVAERRISKPYKAIAALVGIKFFYKKSPDLLSNWNKYTKMQINELANGFCDFLLEFEYEFNKAGLGFAAQWFSGLYSTIPRFRNKRRAEIKILYQQMLFKNLIELFYENHNFNYQEEDGKIFIDGKIKAKRIELIEDPNTKLYLSEYIESSHNPNAILVTDNVKKNDKILVKKGEIFDAPYCRLIAKWEPEKKIISPKYHLFDKWKMYKSAAEELEKQMNFADEKFFAERKARQELQDAHKKLKEYSNNLEEMVKQRTQELEEEKERVVNAHKLLSRYVPPQLAEKILNGDVEIIHNNKRQKLSLFFSDIVDFTRITDAMEPEDMANILNEYFLEMFKIIDKYEGTLAQMIGDGLYVFHGAPDYINDKEHAIRCVKMASDMQLKMKDLNSKWFNEGIEYPFQVRCGINTGVATVGSFGTDKRREYVAMGMQVNIAARLEGSANPGGILISHSTWGHVKDEIDCEEVNSLEVKGLSRPIRAYKVLI
jgi:class 3 adenylate cyclase